MQIKLFETYKTITAEDGMILTYFQEGDDISTYAYARLIISPLNASTELLREITEEEHLTYQKLWEEYEKEQSRE